MCGSDRDEREDPALHVPMVRHSVGQKQEPRHEGRESQVTLQRFQCSIRVAVKRTQFVTAILVLAVANHGDNPAHGSNPAAKSRRAIVVVKSEAVVRELARAGQRVGISAHGGQAIHRRVVLPDAQLDGGVDAAAIGPEVAREVVVLRTRQARTEKQQGAKGFHGRDVVPARLHRQGENVAHKWTTFVREFSERGRRVERSEETNQRTWYGLPLFHPQQPWRLRVRRSLRDAGGCQECGAVADAALEGEGAGDREHRAR